jgi:Tfp pilus assembly protein PilF
MKLREGLMKKIWFGALVLLLCSGLTWAAEEWRIKLEEAKVNLDEGNYQAADKILQDLVASYPEDMEVNYYLGLTKVAQKQYSAAENYFQKANNLKPGDTLVLLDLANVYISLNRPKPAKDALAEVLAREPQNGRALYLRGVAAVQEKDCKSAQEYLEKARKLLPKKAAEINYQLGVCAKNQGKSQDAKKHFDEAIAAGKGTVWEEKAGKQKETLSTQNMFYATGDVFYQYDSNIVPVADEDALPGEISHQEDSRAVLWFKGGFRPLLLNNAGIGLEYHLYNSWQFEEQDMNLQVHQGVLNGYYDFRMGKMPARLYGAYLYQYAGLGKNYSYYGTTHRAGPTLLLAETKNLVTEFNYYYQNETFDDPGEDDFDRDNDAHQLLAGQHFYFWDQQIDLGIFGRYENANAKGKDYDLNRYGVRAIAQLLGWKNLSGWVFFDYDYRDYMHSSYDRVDEVYQAGFEVQYKFWKYLAVFAGMNYADHNSNTENFDYDREIYSAGIRAIY